MIEQILGWIANILFIYGVWILGNKNVKGFYINSIANLLYVWQSILMNNLALFWLSIFLIIINIIGIYKWQFKRNKPIPKETAELNYARTIIDFYKDNNV